MTTAPEAEKAGGSVVPVVITAKYPGRCKTCGRRFKAGTRVIYDRLLGQTYHEPASCGTYAASSRAQ